MNEALRKLKSMNKRPWVYRNKVVEIIGFADYVGEHGDEVEIYLNDGRTIECHVNKLEEKLKEFGSATGTVVTLAHHKLDEVSSVNPTVVKEVRDLVLESIREVKSNPEKISQAKQVFQGVNTLLNIAKTELEYRKYMDHAVPNGGGK